MFIGWTGFVQAQTSPSSSSPVDQTVESADLQHQLLFTQGDQQIAIGAGVLDSYLVMNVAYSYSLLDGFSLGIGGESWMLDSPTFFSVTPEARYTFSDLGVVKPYLAAVFRQRLGYSYSQNYGSLGGRLGLAIQIKSKALTVGVIGVKAVGALGSGQTDYYPEIGYWMSF